MLLERIYDEDLAHASYFVGCQAENKAVVVDPRRDIDVYLKLAEKNGMTIVGVTETHIHADYLSGSRELADRTGAELYVSAEGGEDWQYDFEANRLHHGDSFSIGNITIEARHTPGHTPEHLAFLITDGAFSDQPGYMLTGDFVFSGDLGRPDLLDEAAGGVDTRFGGAKQLFKSLKEEFLTLPDHVQVHPAHGSGSACGKALGAIPSSTVGYERLYAWWAPYLRDDDEQGFVDELLDGQPDAHSYFGRMKRWNREGPAILGEQEDLKELAQATVTATVESGESVFVDTRHHSEVHQGTVENSLNIPPAKAATHGGWAFDPEADDASLILFTPDSETAEEVRDHLMRVGIDNVAGYTTTMDGLPMTTPQVVAPKDLEDTEKVLLLDVRNKGEYAAGHIPGAEQLSASRVLFNQDQLPESGPIVSYCQSGVRNSVAASALRRAGHEVIELEGSYAAWKAWQDTQK